MPEHIAPGFGLMVDVQKMRCEWAGSDPLYIEYHDMEWGVPVHDDRKIFEFLVLEGAQAGLSWITILRKRENYRKAFAGFCPEKVAEFGSSDIKALLNDKGIVRNRMKILSAINNAHKFLEVQDEFGSFDSYIWQFTKGKTIRNRWASIAQLPARSAESEAMSRDLSKRGFTFVGSTICYAHMQATGMVNDHMAYCFRYRQL
ncbi:MAG: DNA-3-methyladenine glycosylase I [Candidatus Micrarchaeaceae archaeon]